MIHLGKLINDGDSVYELDEDCICKKEALERAKEMEWQRSRRQRMRSQETKRKK